MISLNILHFSFPRFSKCWQKQVKKHFRWLLMTLTCEAVWLSAKQVSRHNYLGWKEIEHTLPLSPIIKDVAVPKLSGGSRGGARGARPPPLFSDQTEKIFEDRAPPLSQGLDDRPFPPRISRSGSGTDTRTFSILNNFGEGTVVICHLLSIWFTFKWHLNIFL